MVMGFKRLRTWHREGLRASLVENNEFGVRFVVRCWRSQDHGDFAVTRRVGNRPSAARELNAARLAQRPLIMNSEDDIHRCFLW